MKSKEKETLGSSLRFSDAIHLERIFTLREIFERESVALKQSEKFYQPVFEKLEL